MENIENDAITYLTNVINAKDTLRILWCQDVGQDRSGLLGLLRNLTVKTVSNMVKPKYIIPLSMPSIAYQVLSNEAAFEMKTYIAIAIANELGIMDGSNETLIKNLKDELDKELFYKYKVNKERESNLVRKLGDKIFEKLRYTSYLLVIEYLHASYDRGRKHTSDAMKWLLNNDWLPPPSKRNGVRWVISTTFDIERIEFIPRDENRDVILDLKDLIREKDWPLKGQQLVELALLGCAQSVTATLFPLARASTVRETMDILRSCLLYSLLFSPEFHDEKIELKGKSDSFNFSFRYISDILKTNMDIRGELDLDQLLSKGIDIGYQLLESSSLSSLFDIKKRVSGIEKKFDGDQYNHLNRRKELVRFWIADGLFARSILTMDRPGEEEEEEEERDVLKVANIIDSFHAANVVFEALLSHSLIQHDYSSFVLRCEERFKKLFFDSPPIPFSGMRKLLGSSLGPQNDISNPIDWQNKSWISFLDNNGKWIIHPKRNKTTTLLYRANSSPDLSNIDSLLTIMSNLRVLDFSYSSLKALPASIANLTNLRFLSFKCCQNLQTLRPSGLKHSHSPIAKLHQLEVLNLSGVPLTQVPEEIGSQKHCLYFLDLSCPNITSLPHNLFVEMSGIRELSLLGCKSLKNLPSSLATCLLHLEEFSLSETQLDSLPCGIFEQMQRLRVLKLAGNHRLVHLPNSLSRASILQELKIHDCKALKEVNVAAHPNLKSFSLTKSPQIIRISLRACQALDTVVLSELDNLSELDLSFTSIKEFPLNVCNQGSLRRLDLISVPQLNRVPWHKLSRKLPEVFNLVQHGYEIMGNQSLVVQDSVDESLPLLKDGIGVKILVRDTRLLSLFKRELLLDSQGENLQHPQPLYVSICEQKDQRQNKETTCDNQHENKNPYYKCVPPLENKFKQHFQEHHFTRQGKISSVTRYHFGLEGILNLIESLLVKDNAFTSLTDLNQEFPKLQECILEGCHHMEVVFRETKQLKGKKLQNLWVSNLTNLTDVLHGSFQFDEFRALKYVNLRDCPRLVSVFPGNLELPCLEILSIVCCYSLRSVFYYCQPNDEVQFPRLRSIKLHQLSQLSQLYDNQEHPFRMPEWKELIFRGCWSLCRLPLLTRPRDQKVFVDGDIRQCKMFLSEMDNDQLSCYNFKFLPLVASFKEHVTNSIFLK